jgi:hypothetical protein
LRLDNARDIGNDLFDHGFLLRHREILGGRRVDDWIGVLIGNRVRIRQIVWVGDLEYGVIDGRLRFLCWLCRKVIVGAGSKTVSSTPRRDAAFLTRILMLGNPREQYKMSFQEATRLTRLQSQSILQPGQPATTL